MTIGSSSTADAGETDYSGVGRAIFVGVDCRMTPLLVYLEPSGSKNFVERCVEALK